MSSIGILLATYNGGRFLNQLLDSILNQTERAFTIYVHDDGSSDSTLSILEQYEEKDGRIRLLRYESTGGAKDNFLSLLRRAGAENDYCMFADQDDFWLPDKIEKTLAAIKRLENGETGVPCAVFCDLKVTDDKLNVLHESYVRYTGRDTKRLDFKSLLTRNVAAGCTIMMNRSLALLCSGFKEPENILMHDWWVVTSAALAGRLAFLDEPLILYRQHSDNVVGASRGRLTWAIEKLSNILKGSQLKESRKGIDSQIAIAGELLLLPGISTEAKQFLRELSGIKKESKLKRMAFYRKNRLLKKGIKDQWKILIV